MPSTVGFQSSAVDLVSACLDDAVWYIDAHQASSSQTVPNLGTGGTALDATLGSSGSADSNDPKWLPYSAADGPYVYLPGASGNYLSTPDSAALDVAEIDIAIHCSLDDWTPAAATYLAHKYGMAANLSWRLEVRTSGVLRLTYTTDGATAVNKDSTVAPTVTDGDALWVRATLDGATGDVKFYTAPSAQAVPSSWTQLGSTVSGSGAVTVYSGTSAVEVGRYSSTVMAGRLYRFVQKATIAGTLVLDADCSVLTSGNQTTFTEQSSNAATVTINRAAAGLKTALVGGWAGGGSKWLFGTDDYMEVADNALLDFGASDSFTVLAVVRQWATPTNNGTYLAKYDSATTIGYLIGRQNTTTTNRFVIADGTSTPVATSTGANGPLAVVTGRRDVSGDTITSYTDTTPGSGVTDSTTGTLANTFPLYVGRRSGTATYQDFEFTAAAVWRRALTASEIAALSAYFTTRAHNG